MQRPTTHPPRSQLPTGLIASVALVALLLAAALVAIFWREWLTFASDYPLIADALRFLLFAAPLGLALAYAITGAAIWWRRKGWAGSIAADQAADLMRATKQIAPLATSYSYHDSRQNVPPDDDEEAAALPLLCAESEWLTWTDRAPHLMVAGRTDSGKTTTVEAVLARRIIAGDLILVVDPHYQAGKWLGAYAIGGGRNYEACYQAFDAARALLDRRFKSFDSGTRTEDFKRVTIVVDEVPAIIAHGQSMGKALYERWLLFATSLGSEARKVRISVILLTQSPLVRDIGISSAMRENFSRIALGDTAADLLREEPSAARKQELLELLRGRPYPAAMEYRNTWHALRNDDIPALASANGIAPRWPTLLVAPAPASQQRVITSGLPPTARVAPPVRQSAPPTVPMNITIPEQIVDLLSARSGGYMTASEIAAALRIDLQVARTEISALAGAGRLMQRKVNDKRTRERTEYAVNPSTNKPINALTA